MNSRHHIAGTAAAFLTASLLLASAGRPGRIDASLLGPAADAGKAAKTAEETAPMDPRFHQTILFSFKGNKTNQVNLEAINKQLSKKLPGVPYLYLLSKDTLLQRLNGAPLPACDTTPCALKAGDLAKAHRAITGSVSYKEEVEKKKITIDGSYQYIMKITTRKWYTFNAALVDITGGKEIARFTQKAEEKDLVKAVNSLIGEIAKYYQPREVTPPHIEVETPAHIIGTPPEISKDTSFKCTPFIHYSLSSLVPVGKFADVISYAFGMVLTGGVKDLAIENSVVMLSAGGYFLSVPAEGTDRFGNCFVSLHLGYSFKVTDRIAVVPAIGTGYFIHFIEKAESSSHTYYDPLLSFRSEIHYALLDFLHLFLSPGYIVFFEKTNTGMAVQIDAGVLYYFL